MSMGTDIVLQGALVSAIAGQPVCDNPRLLVVVSVYAYYDMASEQSVEYFESSSTIEDVTPEPA